MPLQKAWTWERFGEPAALVLREKPVPIPGTGEILVNNMIAALNPVDWKIIAAGHTAWKPGHVPGVDGVGQVVAIGDGVHLPLGTRVAYHQSLARDGSFAEYTCISADSALLVPPGLSDELAATVPCPGLTAWQALQKVPPLPGRDVLITGAGGAVGHFLMQMALARSWRVWVTASPKRHPQLLSLGVSGCFDYHDDAWQRQLEDRLEPRRLFAIFDTTGGAYAASLAPMIGYNGHLVCIQDRIETQPLPPFTTSVSLHEVALNAVYEHGTAQDWQDWREAGHEVLQMVAIGRLRSPRILVMPFSGLSCALELSKSRKIEGKALVRF
ncbi:zinc-binding dehydrogenase [Arboricoccus pini]